MELFNQSHPPSGWRNKFKLLHIPKTGGTTVEWYMGISNDGHFPLIGRPGWRSTRWITVVRDPLDQLLSTYFFYQSGDMQWAYKNRQGLLCQNGTGRAFHR
eukprot:5285776-Amphidinium_carterae.1